MNSKFILYFSSIVSLLSNCGFSVFLIDLKQVALTLISPVTWSFSETEKYDIALKGHTDSINIISLAKL